ncbi:predicted protein [Histoplasma mississippiense (nom. inval.)]|uniref:predicted protein n=1 Tax=Ajellomyces capsulatus (strain NAm1 / WU24) TaxID=2059318 RepID=UPI000157BB92|nr:predicted protein [Histoplasma mississippiense (nom. inval.)]EDN05721.1 predicted protein [Histoplasma mississippiense (nom. inval.)]
MPIAPQKWILWELGQVLQEFHVKNWIYIGNIHQPAHQIQALTKFPLLNVKSDNVMVDYRYNQAAPERVVLGDLDCSLKLKGDKLLRLPDGVKIGNVMWCRQGIGKSLDVFFYELVCLYTNHRCGNSAPGFQAVKERHD